MSSMRSTSAERSVCAARPDQHVGRLDREERRHRQRPRPRPAPGSHRSPASLHRRTTTPPRLSRRPRSCQGRPASRSVRTINPRSRAPLRICFSSSASRAASRGASSTGTSFATARPCRVIVKCSPRSTRWRSADRCVLASWAPTVGMARAYNQSDPRFSSRWRSGGQPVAPIAWLRPASGSRADARLTPDSRDPTPVPVAGSRLPGSRFPVPDPR